MPDYKEICTRLILSLCDIIDGAKAAIEEAEESIISDETNLPQVYSQKEEEQRKC